MREEVVKAPARVARRAAVLAVVLLTTAAGATAAGPVLRDEPTGTAAAAPAAEEHPHPHADGAAHDHEHADAAHAHDHAHAHDDCGPGEEVRVPGEPTACVHADEPPPGVDVTEPVSTAELRSRTGAGIAAYEAANDLGVPSPVTAAASVTDPSVPCDGDGTSGYRVQAMYVVEADKANRYASLLPQFRLWAAGVDDVFNRAAAVTGGVRHVRYVTEAGGSGCVARVLNVTVPTGSMTSFDSTINAVRALGYTNPARKYLMWTDASVLCGIAKMYLDDRQDQANANNGAYAQYSRIDSGCWGHGNTTTAHSVEAHELVHNLGGVQNSAPHATRVGHCWDESDAMCYADGGGFPMRQVCPPGTENLLDCNVDDYYSTYPPAGSYLDRFWNSADSRFLIGGGDGTSGGTAGTPTSLGATVGVNNPAVPGLPTQVEVTPELPADRTVASVQWRSARPDCTFSAPTAEQSEVTCNATATGSTTVTVTVTDSSGATRTVSSPLTFATGTARPVAVGLKVAGEPTAPPAAGAPGAASVCTGAIAPVAATVVDAATGLRVKGLNATFTRKTAAMTAPASIGAAVTDATGSGAVHQTISVATRFTAATTASATYAAGSPVAVDATPGRCTVALDVSSDVPEPGGDGTSLLYHSDPVTVTGLVTRTAGGEQLPVSALSVPITLTTSTTSSTGVTSTRTTILTTARTGADGRLAVTVKPTASGVLRATVPGTAGYERASVDLGTLRVVLPTTDLTGAVDRTDVGYEKPVIVTGRLTRTGVSTTPVAGQLVSVKVAPPGRTPQTIGSGRTTADGSYRISVPLRLSGEMTVTFAGGTGLPADTVALGPVVAGAWTPSISASTPSTTVAAGTIVTLSATVNRTYAGVTEPAVGLVTRVWFTPTGSSTPTLVVSPIVPPTGTYFAKVTPRVSGTYVVKVTASAGYTAAESAPVSITVS